MKNISLFSVLIFFAFTSFSQNKPLPMPYATDSKMNFSKVIGWSEGQTPKAPAGFKVHKYAGDLVYPRWFYVLPNGDVLVAEAKKEEKGLEKVGAAVIGASKTHGEGSNRNQITLFRDKNNDGMPDERFVFLGNQDLPFGMLLLNGYIYVANTGSLSRYKYEKGQTALKGPSEKIAEYPPMGRHWTRNIIASKDGKKIYIAVGSASNVAENGIDEEKNRACILEINPDGSGMKVYASGLRNPVGMAWAPGTNTLWTAVNERDELGDDLPPDYITSVKEGGFYGWPYSYYGKNLDPRIEDKDQRPDLVSKAIVPDLQLGTHTASLGLCFYEAKSFPPRYINGAFVGQHGSWNRSILSGYKVVFIPFNNGKPGMPEDFLTGFIADQEKSQVYGRPCGVAILPDGSLLVADDAANTIWRVSYTK